MDKLRSTERRQAAEQTIQTHETLRLTEREARDIKRMLLDPGPINPNLVRAADDYKPFVGGR